MISVNFMRYRLVPWYLFVNLCFSADVVLADTEVIIGIGEWSPYTSSELPDRGFVSGIVTEAFSAVVIEVKFVFLPWARAIQIAKYGNLAATFPWLRSSERETNFLFSDPLFYTDNLTMFVLGANAPACLNFRISRGFASEQNWVFTMERNSRISKGGDFSRSVA